MSAPAAAADRPVELLLARLDGVRECGSGRWMARCPAHDDARPSLSIREGDDGRVLLHCFAGCGGAAVIHSLGLAWQDLYPQRHREADLARPGVRIPPASKRAPIAPRIPARDALDQLDLEALVVQVVAADLLAGRPLDDEARAALATAATRIAAVRYSWLAAP